MPNKLTDTEIKKALECCGGKAYCQTCHYKNRGDCLTDIKFDVIDLINRKDKENESLKAERDAMHQDVKAAEEYAWNLKEQLKTAEAEVKRLQNAYKQCAWERDIFAEDMKEEIKKDCSYLMLDIKKIKTEAYKEFANNIEREFSKTENQMPNSEVIKQTVQICRNAIRLALNELVGD